MASVLESAAGLTRYEAENAFSLSLIRDGCLRADVVWDLKAQTVAIPPDKLEELIWVIKAVLSVRKISGEALEKLIGKIMHWSQLCQLTKPLCYQAICFVHRQIRANKRL